MKEQVKAEVVSELGCAARWFFAFVLFVGPLLAGLWTAAAWKQSVDMQLQELNRKVDWLIQHEKSQTKPDGKTENLPEAQNSKYDAGNSPAYAAAQ